MGYCDLLFLTTLAYQISDCLCEDELSQLASDVVMLGETLNAISTRRANDCKNMCTSKCKMCFTEASES